MLMRSPLARDRRQPPGFVRPCQPVISLKVPVGDGWIHELKHDGFRIIARKERDHVRLWSRNGRNWSAEFVAITAALGELPTDFVLDGEAVAHCSHGLPDFHGLLGRDASPLGPGLEGSSDEGVAGFLIIQDENRGGPDVEGTLEPAQAAQIRPMLMCSPAWRRRLPRIIARQEGDQIRLWSRNGRDWSAEFVAITAALRGLPADLYWTAAVAHCSQGLPDFRGLLGRDGQRTACLYVAQADCGILPDRQLPLHAIGPVLQPPQTPARSRYQQIEAPAVAELVIALASLRGPDRSVGQRHVDSPCWKGPQKGGRYSPRCIR